MNILVVDDEPGITDCVARILHNHGYRALALYNNSEDALEHAAGGHFDLAFVGVVMPGMCGLELGARIKSLLPHCRIVLFVEAIPGGVESIRSQGYDFEYLPAPFESEALLNTVYNAERQMAH